MGGRFCGLDQLYKKFSGNDVLRSPKLNEDQKQEKGIRRKLVIFPRNQMKIKKGLRRKLRPFFGRKFVGSFSPGWLFFLWSSSAQLSMGGRLTLDGGTPNSRWGDVSPLPSKY